MKPARKDYPMPRPDQIAVSLNEACALVGCGLSSIRQAIDDGRLPAHRLGKKVLIRRGDLDAFLKSLPRAGV